MQKIIDASREVMRRLISAAYEKDRRSGDWRLLLNELGTANDVVAYEQQEAQIRFERELKQAQLDESLTEEQRQLKARMEHAKAEMDVVGEDVYQDAQRAFLASFTQDQSGLNDAITALLTQQVAFNVRAGRIKSGEHYHLLTCPAPYEMGKEVARAVCDVLNGALHRSLFGTPPTLSGRDDVLNIIYDEADRRFTLHYFRNGGMLPKLFGMNIPGREIDLSAVDLQATSDMLENEVASALRHPRHWKSVNVPQGKEYVIEKDERFSSNLVYQVVSRLAYAPQYNDKEVMRSCVVDGVSMLHAESRALFAREKDNPSIQHDVKSRILLTGQAAEDILGAMDVDKGKIKEISRRER